MSRRSRQRAAALAAPASAPAPLVGEPGVRPLSATGSFWGIGSGGWGWGQGYNAADSTPDRGYVYFPEMDTRRELTPYTRLEVTRRVRYLCKNVGFPRRIINGISRMVVGTGLMVRPATRDSRWNELSRKNFEERTGSAASYDLGRRYNFSSGQRPTLRFRYRDGDLGKVLARLPNGAGRVAFYESHQIGSGRTEADKPDAVFDGVGVDRHNGAIFYRLVSADGQTQVDVPIESFIYVGDYASAGAHRSESILEAAVNHMLDWTEVTAAMKSGIKAASRIGYYIGKDSSKGGTDIPSLPRRAPGGTATVTNQAGQSVKTEKVFNSAGGEIPELPPGADIKQLLDQRPHPNTMGFYEHLARDMSWSADFSPELLWNIATLGSANTRYVMADAQSFLEQEQQLLIDQDLGREYVWFTSLDLASGKLPPCEDPEWWKHDWITPARTTIDYSRDGKLYLEQLRSGALTWRRFYGMQGLDSKPELREWLDEYAFIRNEAIERELDPEKVLSALYARVGLAPVTPAADPIPADPAADAED